MAEQSEPLAEPFEQDVEEAISQSDSKESAKIFARILENNPSRAGVHHLLGLAYLTLGQADDAVETLKKALAAYPTNPEISADLGRARKALGEQVGTKYDYAKKWLAKIALLFVVVVGLSVATEYFFRALLSDQLMLFPRHQVEWQYGDFILRGNEPNARFVHTSADGSWEFRTNSRGFRSDREYTYAKPEGVVRILVLGDSHTYGYEVRQDQTYAEIIERYLRRNGIAAEVINTGVAGFSNAEQLIFLQNEGIKYSPDYVVLGFNASDLSENVMDSIFILRDGKLELQKKAYIPGRRIRRFFEALPLWNWLNDNSFLVNYINRLASDFIKKRMLSSGYEAGVGNDTENPSGEIKSVSQNEKVYESALAHALVREIARTARQNGAKFIFFDLPENKSLKPSFPERLIPRPPEFSDFVVEGRKILQDYKGLAELYVPNGMKHLAAFGHLKAGLAIGRVICEAQIKRRGAGVPATGCQLIP